jgi:hypothetical protein
MREMMENLVVRIAIYEALLLVFLIGLTTQTFKIPQVSKEVYMKIFRNHIYRMRAIISRSRFEAALVYKPRILSLKKESRNNGRSVA